MVTINFQ